MGQFIQPTTLAVDDSSIGTIAWNNVGNAYVLDGIYVDSGSFGVGSTPSDNSIKMVQGGVITGNDDTGGTISTGANAFRDYGTPTELWGLTWTPADVNASNFGIAYSAKRGAVIGHYLKCTGFGFNIRSTATILGFVGRVYRYRDNGIVNLDFVQMTVYFNDAQLINVSTMTNISSITF